MTTEVLEQAIATTRGVLANVSRDQLDDATPCASWKVRDLINHIVGGQYFFAGGVRGELPSGETDWAAGDFLADFDTGARQCVDAFNSDGAMDKMLTLPFGQMPGSAFIGLASTDTFTHGLTYGNSYCFTARRDQSDFWRWRKFRGAIPKRFHRDIQRRHVSS